MLSLSMPGGSPGLRGGGTTIKTSLQDVPRGCMAEKGSGFERHPL